MPPLSKVTNTALTGRDLFQLFFKSPLRFIPVIATDTIGKIFSFVSKDKLFSKENIDSFLEETINHESLLHLLDEQPSSSFFRTLDTIEISEVPLILFSKNQITSQKLTLIRFWQCYKPLSKLLANDFEQIIIDLPFPVYFYNCQLKLLFANKIGEHFMKYFLDHHSDILSVSGLEKSKNNQSSEKSNPLPIQKYLEEQNLEENPKHSKPSHFRKYLNSENNETISLTEQNHRNFAESIVLKHTDIDPSRPVWDKKNEMKFYQFFLKEYEYNYQISKSTIDESAIWSVTITKW